MTVSSKDVKALRDRTGAGMMDCKRALEECGGDQEKAVEFLRVKGLAAAKQKATRTASDGIVASYIHPGDKLGVMLEVNCETDFVARHADFRSFVKDLAMHIAATDPLAVSRDGIGADVIERERKIAEEQAREQNKPEKVIAKIVEGRVEKFLAENALLEQPFVKDPEKTVRQYVDEHIAKFGENIVVRRFARFKLGE